MDRMMRMRGLLLGQLVAVALAMPACFAPAGAETVLPRVGPLPLVAEDGSLTGSAEVAFGQPLRVVSQQGAVLTVSDAAGQEMRVRTTDVLAAPREGLTLMPVAGLSPKEIARPDLPLWDSAMRGRIFLGGAAAGGLVPPLTIPGGTDLSATALPVVSVDHVATSVGTPVTLVQALFPLRPGALDPAGAGASPKVMLHVLVDGSDYARTFMLDRLRRLSRTLAQGDAGLGADLRFSRQIVSESGSVRDEGDMPAAGLRAEWPEEANPTATGHLTEAVAKAVVSLAATIRPDDGTTHLVLILAGPGLSQDAAAQKAIAAAGRRLADLRAKGADLRMVVLAQGTPEPNPANETALAGLAGDAGQTLLGFGDDPVPALAKGLAAVAPGAQAGRAQAICAEAAADGLPCLLPSAEALPAGVATALAGTPLADWVALPLWLVADSAPFDLVPTGLAPAEAHAAQADIRQCHAMGDVWTAGTCAARTMDADAQPAQIAALQEEVTARVQERDAARQTLSDSMAAWEKDRADLAARIGAAETARDGALSDAAEKADLILRQTAELDQARADLASQADEVTRLSGQVDALQADLSAAQDRAAALTASLDERTAERDTARTEATALADARDQALSALKEAQDQAAAVDAARADLAQSLADAQALAAADHEAQLKEVADLTAQMTGLQSALDQARAEARDMTAQRDALSADLGEATAARTAAEAAVQAATARIAALEQQVQSLTETAAAAGRAQAQAEADLDEARQKHADDQTESAATIADLRARVSELTADQDARTASASDAGAEMEKRLTALRGERDALNAKVADLQADLQKAERAGQEAARNGQASAAALAEAQQHLASMQADMAALQDQMASVVKERDALTARMDAEALAAGTRLAEMQADRDHLAKQVADLQAAAEIAAREQAKTTAKIAAQAETGSAQVAAVAVPDATAAPAAGDSLFAKGDGGHRPKPRPSRSASAAAAVAKQATPNPATGTAGPLATLATPRQTAKPAVLRQVAPSTRARGLNGCTFEWMGQEGRLICP